MFLFGTAPWQLRVVENGAAYPGRAMTGPVRGAACVRLMRSWRWALGECLFGGSRAVGGCRGGGGRARARALALGLQRVSAVQMDADGCGL